MPTKDLVAETMPKPKRNDVPVKLDAEVVRLARIVAAYRDQTLAEYVSERLRPFVSEDLARHQQESPAPPDPGRKRRRAD